MNMIAEMGLAGPAIASGITPEADGYCLTRLGLPYHVHPEATPDEWVALGDAIAAGEIEVQPYQPPVVSNTDALADLRARRDALLTACDWTQLADSPPDAKAWGTYRQALRDLPAKFAKTPQDVVFPEPPGA